MLKYCLSFNKEIISKKIDQKETKKFEIQLTEVALKKPFTHKKIIIKHRNSGSSQICRINF